MLTIGLTGGIASGKSKVSEILNDLGMKIIDADIIARDVVDDLEIKEKIKNEFGYNIYSTDDTLNRKMLGNIVFNDIEKLNRLDNIMHPAIRTKIKNILKCNELNGVKTSVIDAALLVEANYIDLIDIMILIYVPEYIQIERLMKRNNLSEKDAKDRIKSQMPFEIKKKYSDYVIDNSFSVEYTREQVNKILRDIKLLEE